MQILSQIQKILSQKRGLDWIWFQLYNYITIGSGTMGLANNPLIIQDLGSTIILSKSNIITFVHSSSR